MTIISRSIPMPKAVQLNCAWCWSATHTDGTPFPEQWSSTICDEHQAWMLAQLESRKRQRDWQACIEAFLASNPSETSRQRYRSTVNCFLRKMDGRSFDDITNEDIEAFATTVSRHRNHGNESTKNTQSRRRTILAALYHFASVYQVDGMPLYQGPLPVRQHPPVSTPAPAFAQLSPDWQACIAAWLHQIENHSGSVRSRETYQTTLKLFFADTTRDPDTVTRADVDAFLTQPSHSPRNPGAAIAPGTRNHRLMVLSGLYRFAATFEWQGEPLLQAASPALGFHYVKVGARYRGMSMAEFERLLAAIPTDTEKGTRDRALILFYFFTGRRRCEVQRLCWRDLEQGMVVDPDGTRRQAITYAFRSKGRSREIQHAELPQPAWLALVHYLQVSGRLDTMQPDSPLFSSTRQAKGQAPLGAIWINTLVKAYARAAGLPSDISLHSIRHCAARCRYEQGMKLVELKSWLGHTSLDTTWRYVQGLSGTSDAFAQVLEQRFAFLSVR